ncbi:MAG TPA: methyltransferase domain-containing protein [Terriglobia bacterium]|nr:methyltransferase domain-containing protein [Terriglobia bacterium]
MAKRRKVIGQALILFVFATWAMAQVRHQRHHPPDNINEYIEHLEDPSRNQWQQPEKVMKALEIKPGETIADLGSGPGYFTLRFARAVGPKGKVFAVDISPGMLAYLKKQARAVHLTNIKPILAKPDNPELSPSSVDMIFICDTLHHISNRAKYYPFLMRALKPGGRLVNIDFYKRTLPVGPPVHMKIAKPEMIKEAEAAGFHLAKQLSFLEYQYFLVFER